MIAAQVSAYELSEEFVTQDEGVAYYVGVNAFVESENARKAVQLIAELIEGAEAPFCFRDVVRVGLEVCHESGVVDMGDRHMALFQLFAEEHIFVATLLEALVERTAQHELSLNDEVCGAEMVVRSLHALLSRMHGLGLLFVQIAQIAGAALSDAYAAVDYASAIVFQVVDNEVGTDNVHVAIEEEQPLVMTLLRQEVAGCGTACILFFLDEVAVGKLVDGSVCLDARLLWRTVVGYKNFVAEIVKLIG